MKQLSVVRKELFVLLLLIFSGTLAVSAQNDEPVDSAPPPLKILSKEEKAQLEPLGDIKKRTRLGLDLMEIRLKKAETFNTEANYEQMFVELGGFHALMDNTLGFLNRNDNGRDKVLYNFKRLELNLRTFLTRIETIRRELPPKYDAYVKSLAKLVREARAKAVEPLFSDTVVPQN